VAKFLFANAELSFTQVQTWVVAKMTLYLLLQQAQLNSVALADAT
jgi:hypothetical protein